MKKYIGKRLLEVIPVLFIITFVIFILVYHSGDSVSMMLPKDASQAYRENMCEAMGLNEPFLIQYGSFLKDVSTGNFGVSTRYNTEALPLVLDRFPATFELAGAALIVSILISIPLGIWSANR